MLNVVALQGRITSDPELKHTQSDVAVTSFTLAVQRGYKQGGEYETDWVDVVAWRNTAEFICKYFGKGQLMALTGSIQTRTWEDKQGNKRKSVEIVAKEVSFCGKSETKKGMNEGQVPLPETPVEDWLDSDADLLF